MITNKRKTHLFYMIIHFSVQFSAIVNRFIVKKITYFYFYKWFKKKIKNFEKYQKLQSMQL